MNRPLVKAKYGWVEGFSLYLYCIMSTMTDILTLYMWMTSGVDTNNLLSKNHIFSQKFNNVTFHVHIQNQHEKCIRMKTNKPTFGPVVLEIAGDIYKNRASSFHRSHYVVSVKSVCTINRVYMAIVWAS